MPLDMLITGRIATLGGDTGYGWVEAIGIRGGRIAFAGSEVDLETRADPFTERIRLEPDQVAIPGLTDAHLHLTQAALASRHVDLGDAATLDEGLARLRAAHEPGRPAHLARILRKRHRRGQRLERQERGRAGAFPLQVAERGPRVLEALDHHPLQPIAEDRFHCLLEAVRHLQEIGDGADHAAQLTGA